MPDVPMPDVPMLDVPMLDVPMLDVRGIAKSFRGLKAVDGVSFTVPQGAIVALIGPNGAGKTTTFNLINGVLRPDSGQVLVGGVDVTGLRPDQICHAGVGRTFQIVKPFARLSVEDNVLVGALQTVPDVAGARRHARDVLALLGLDRKAAEPANRLTLPERKRLETARALATRPKILLLDEVMAGLRPVEIDLMVETLTRLSAETGLTILLIEHVMRAVMALSRQVVVLNYGRKIADGTPAEVARDPAVLSCYLGEEAV